MISLSARGRGIALAPLFLLLPLAAPAQQVRETVDLGAFERIRDEGLNRSHIEDLAWYLNDVIGPRLTGSSGMRRANEWTAERFLEWGLTNVVIDPWGEFGMGWERVFYAGRVVEPFAQPLIAQPVAWTGSTDGRVTGPAVLLEVESLEDLERYRGRLRGAFVLWQEHSPIGPQFEAPARRLDLETILPDVFRRSGDGPAGRPGGPPQIPPDREAAQRRAQARAALPDFAREEGVAAILTPSLRPYGILRGGGRGAGRQPGAPTPAPELIVASEQYGQIWRNLQRDVSVTLELEIENRFLDQDLRQYNTLGDIRGTDLAHEYVMIGAHLDSWHYGTGATDNAAGSIVMMEAMRILRATGLQPRRTIRIALWSGEEQGLLGSRFWVQNNQDLWPGISAYLNVDNGTGRIRGMRTQGNELVVPVFEQILWPFRDLGAVVVNTAGAGGTDHLSFDRVGVPGFNFLQDPIEYSTRTHHTNMDTFDRLLLDDLKQAAVIVAATAYHLAMRDEMLPRPGTAEEEVEAGR